MKDPAPSPSTPPALCIEGLRFRHPGASNGAWTIDLPALALASGEQALLEGGSGTGKSTLLLLVAGLLDPDAGRVQVGGTDIHRLRGSRRDRFRGAHLGMIFQTFHLLEGFTAIENVLAALMFSELPAAEHRSRATTLLESLGIDRPEARPDQLSVGQQQRVAVARALACRPVLVLADEPTASLDPNNAAAAMDLIQEACRANGAALLCTSHDPAMKERFARTEAIGSAPTGRG